MIEKTSRKFSADMTAEDCAIWDTSGPIEYQLNMLLGDRIDADIMLAKQPDRETYATFLKRMATTI